MAAGQSQRFYSGVVGIINWYYLSSPPQILRFPVVDLETGELMYNTRECDYFRRIRNRRLIPTMELYTRLT